MPSEVSPARSQGSPDQRTCRGVTVPGRGSTTAPALRERTALSGGGPDTIRSARRLTKCQDVSERISAVGHRRQRPVQPYPSGLSGSPSKGLARTVDWSGDRCARTRLFTLRRVNGGFEMLDESSKIRHRCPTDRITRPALLVAIHVTTLGGSPVPPSGAALNPLLIGPSAQSRQPPACSPAVQTPQRRA